MRILITGGAGFVGSSLAVGLSVRHPGWAIICFDNLKRRGSELNLPRLREADATFVHGDVRVASDLAAVGVVDLILDCSAEPSVIAGLDGSPSCVIDTNLTGTVNCLELARAHRATLLFLSTSRVYPIAALSAIPRRENATRFELALDGAPPVPGLSEYGIAEEFPLHGVRSLYGATKLCSELLIAEYAAAFGLRTLINRCGVIAGPWQMGRFDQGIVAHWVASHHFGRPLSYFGYGGTGKQVRDLLHIDDLADLVERQVARLDELAGRTFNVGGGREISVSLAELTELCVAATGKSVPIGSIPETRAADVPIYLTDARRVREELGWRPRRAAREIVVDTAAWLDRQSREVAEALRQA